MSIDVRELRIGNWVNHKQYGHCTVAELEAWQNNIGVKDPLMQHYVFTKCEVEPIPLTEEILLKCGFNKQGRNDYPRTIIYRLQEMTIFPANSCCDFEGYGFIYCKLSDEINEENGGINESAKFKFKYLHQLMNLYYSLTGKELNYSPN